MSIFFTIVHVLLCVFMIFVILLQPGKDAGMGAAFGGGAATSAFGGRGAVTFLSKVTAACAALFFLTSLGLSFVGTGSSVAGRIAPATPPSTTAPAAPETVEEAPASAPAEASEAPAQSGQEDAPLPLDVPPPEPAQQMGGQGTEPAPAPAQ